MCHCYLLSSSSRILLYWLSDEPQSENKLFLLTLLICMMVWWCDESFQRSAFLRLACVENPITMTASVIAGDWSASCDASQCSPYIPLPVLVFSLDRTHYKYIIICPNTYSSIIMYHLQDNVLLLQPEAMIRSRLRIEKVSLYHQFCFVFLEKFLCMQCNLFLCMQCISSKFTLCYMWGKTE